MLINFNEQGEGTMPGINGGTGWRNEKKYVILNFTKKKNYWGCRTE